MNPTHLLAGKGLRLARDPVAKMDYKAQLLVAVSVINGDQLSAHSHRNAELLLQLTSDAGFDRFVLLLFATGELTSLLVALPRGAGRSAPPRQR